MGCYITRHSTPAKRELAGNTLFPIFFLRPRSRRLKFPKDTREHGLCESIMEWSSQLTFALTKLSVETQVLGSVLAKSLFLYFQALGYLLCSTLNCDHLHFFEGGLIVGLIISGRY